MPVLFLWSSHNTPQQKPQHCQTAYVHQRMPMHFLWSLWFNAFFFLTPVLALECHSAHSIMLPTGLYNVMLQNAYLQTWYPPVCMMSCCNMLTCIMLTCNMLTYRLVTHWSVWRHGATCLPPDLIPTGLHGDMLQHAHIQTCAFSCQESKQVTGF